MVSRPGSRRREAAGGSLHTVPDSLSATPLQPPLAQQHSGTVRTPAVRARGAHGSRDADQHQNRRFTSLQSSVGWHRPCARQPLGSTRWNCTLRALPDQLVAQIICQHPASCARSDCHPGR
ncbi:unnamed protein product [Diplocarpon coronariae]